ncbi:MAG: YbfB/YjiJ family MFS transporter [Rhodocyclaceae bacterium]|nr:YbfB/YjiJ family MFS transporter [Rhodocyclaceae bacterium]
MSTDAWIHPLGTDRAHWPAVGAGLAASLVGIGLARFAYTPLLPAMVDSGWFPAPAAAFLGAANLAGYLLGALGGRWLARRSSAQWVMRLMMLLAGASFVACAFPLSEAWFFAWRLLSGIAGGAIMVLVSSLVLPTVPARQKGLASGAIFLGIGLGIVLSATIVPLMLRTSLQATWLAMGLTALALTAASWAAWPATPGPAGEAARPHRAPRLAAPMRTLLAQYALMAFGLVPEMLFLVDHVVRSLHKGQAVGAEVWLAYGLGAAAGPLLYGMAAHRWGARATIRTALAVQIAAVGALVLSTGTAAVLLLAAVIGTFPSGAVPAALARVHEHVQDHSARQRLWSLATVSFALMQAVSGYAYSALYQVTHGHHVLLFGIGALAYVLALAIDIGPRRRPVALG